MDLKFNSTIIFAKDVSVLKEFYTEELYQEIELDTGNYINFKGGFSIYELELDSPIATHLKRQYSESGNQNMELCFETDDFKTIARNIKKSGVELLHGVIKESWGQKSIRFYDPEENLVEVCETFSSFIRRLYNYGLSVEQICKKTGFNEELVNSYVS